MPATANDPATANRTFRTAENMYMRACDIADAADEAQSAAFNYAEAVKVDPTASTAEITKANAQLEDADDICSAASTLRYNAGRALPEWSTISDRYAEYKRAKMLESAAALNYLMAKENVSDLVPSMWQIWQEAHERLRKAFKAIW